jgi:hypothetical protein
MNSVILTLDFIYDEILSIQSQYPNVYKIYKDELNVRLHADLAYSEIYTFYNGSLEYPVFKVFDVKKTSN